MNESNDNPLFPSTILDSENSVNFIDNGPGDTTPRPFPPEILAKARSEKEKIELWLAWRKQQRQQEQKPNDPKEGQQS